MVENAAIQMIIVGSAPCAADDIARLPKMGPRKWMAVGMDAIDKCPGRVDYIATNHPEDIPVIRQIMRERSEAAGGNTDYQIIGPGVESVSPRAYDIIEPYRPPSGSSAITGATAAITMGHERIVLCGCPLTGNAPEGNPYEAFRPGWIANKDLLYGKVTSMSGWTREVFGGPVGITIGACWDGGAYYPPEYVNRLFHACLRNTDIPFDFVLYVGPLAEQPGRLDDIDPAIRVIPVGLPYWWSGLRFWDGNAPGIFTDTILYLDLDQVIVGSLDDIINFPSPHACMKDWPTGLFPGREQDACVSTTLIRGGAGQKIWDEYLKAGAPVWNPLGPVKGPLPMACQEIVNGPQYGVKKDLFPENWVCSYRLHVLKRGLPADCRIVAFHGRPKQHEVEDHFIKEHWR